MSAAPGQAVASFRALVDEQTPGGYNESNISRLEGAGVFTRVSEALDATLDRVRGKP